PSRSDRTMLSSNRQPGRSANRAHASIGSGAGVISATSAPSIRSALITLRPCDPPPSRRATPVRALPGGREPPLPIRLDLLARGFLLRREIAPGQLAFLPVRLAERDGEPGLHELLAQVEGVGRFVAIQLREDLADVGPDDEALRVEAVDPLPIRAEPVVEVLQLRPQRAELGLRVRDGFWI